MWIRIYSVHSVYSICVSEKVLIFLGKLTLRQNKFYFFFLIKYSSLENIRKNNKLVYLKLIKKIIRVYRVFQKSCTFSYSVGIFLSFGKHFTLEPSNDLSKLYSTLCYTTHEPPHDKTNKMACAPSEDSDQLGHPPSLIRSSLSA